MTEHTPGPWHVRMQRVDPRPYIYAGDVLLAKTYRTTLHNRLTQEIGEANAALIAAAPDLLAAAEEAYSAIREYDFLYHKADGDVTEQRQAVFAVAANLEAAIKKAKGQ